MPSSLPLTRTQTAALAKLRADGRLWPAPRGRYAIAYGHSFSDATVGALVDAGVAEWAPKRDGVLPHVVPAGTAGSIRRGGGWTEADDVRVTRAVPAVPVRHPARIAGSRLAGTRRRAR